MIKKLIGGVAALIIAGTAAAVVTSPAEAAWSGDGSTVCQAGFYPYEGSCFPVELLDHDPNYTPDLGGRPTTPEAEEEEKEAPVTVTVTKTVEAEPEEAPAEEGES